MSDLIDFYFDISSPYGYLASTRIEAIAERHGRSVAWHPVLLGAIFKVSGQAPLTTFPLKGDYALHDFARSAREHKTPYNAPDPFPISTVAPARACYWLSTSSDAKLAAKQPSFIKALFKAFYVDGVNISEPAAVLDVAESMDIDKEALAAGMSDQKTKDTLRDAVEKAIEIGIFGSPMMVVDGELFWGNDRLEQLDRWLASGGW